jgi:hypothetical protein
MQIVRLQFMSRKKGAVLTCCAQIRCGHSGFLNECSRLTANLESNPSENPISLA